MNKEELKDFLRNTRIAETTGDLHLNHMYYNKDNHEYMIITEKHIERYAKAWKMLRSYTRDEIEFNVDSYEYIEKMAELVKTKNIVVTESFSMGYVIEKHKYLVVGNTYDIKEELKAAGARWLPDYRGWYFEEKPENFPYKLQEVKEVQLPVI